MAAIGLLVLLGLGADWLTCRTLMHAMQGQLNQWARSMREQGFTVVYGQPVESYEPWAALLTVPNLSVSGGKAVLPGGLQWHAPRVDLSLSVLHPSRLTLQPSGAQTLKAAGVPAVEFFADQISAVVPLDGATADEIRIEAEGFVGNLSPALQHQDLRIGKLTLSLQAARGGAARTSAWVTLAARDIALPDSGLWPLGATINRFAAAISLASPALSGDAPVEQARAWKDWGGVLTVQSLELHWGPLTLEGAAELGLDDKLQPEGQGRAHVGGWKATLDALARGGTIQPGVAQTAEAVLASMAQPSQTLELPFTLQQCTLSVGRIPLMHFNEIAWGGS